MSQQETLNKIVHNLKFSTWFNRGQSGADRIEGFLEKAGLPSWMSKPASNVTSMFVGGAIIACGMISAFAAVAAFGMTTGIVGVLMVAALAGTAWGLAGVGIGMFEKAQGVVMSKADDLTVPDQDPRGGEKFTSSLSKDFHAGVTPSSQLTTSVLPGVNNKPQV